mgnify:CR=1 FL=1
MEREHIEGYYKPLLHIADEKDEGRMLRDVLRKRIGISRRLWTKLKASEEGVTVNGSPVQSCQLSDGDMIRVGHSSLVFRAHG